MPSIAYGLKVLASLFNLWGQPVVRSLTRRMIYRRSGCFGVLDHVLANAATNINDLRNFVGFLDVFSGIGTISFTEKTQPEYLFRTLLPQCVSIMARLP